MAPSVPSLIPRRIQHLIACHVSTVRAFNDTVTQIRQDYARFGSPGRYEWEYRKKYEASAEDALRYLAQIEAVAPEGVSLEDLYGPEGRPTITPWSAEALTWVRP